MFQGLKICDETLRRCIKNDLNFSYKKVYFRSYKKDDRRIQETRFWLTCALFEHNNMYTDKYMKEPKKRSCTVGNKLRMYPLCLQYPRMVLFSSNL